jgi:hypothetical protein
MRLANRILLLSTLFLLLGLGLGGCDSPGYSGSSSSSVHMGYSYGMGYYDPWYRHGYYGPPVIVNPPPRPPRPDRPVHLPSYPTNPRPTPRPMPATRR